MEEPFCFEALLLLGCEKQDTGLVIEAHHRLGFALNAAQDFRQGDCTGLRKDRGSIKRRRVGVSV